MKISDLGYMKGTEPQGFSKPEPNAAVGVIIRENKLTIGESYTRDNFRYLASGFLLA